VSNLLQETAWIFRNLVANVHTAGNEGFLFMVGLLGKAPTFDRETTQRKLKIASGRNTFLRAQRKARCRALGRLSLLNVRRTEKMSGFFALQAFGNRIDLIFSKPESLL
jgi:hypothetical protein